MSTSAKVVVTLTLLFTVLYLWSEFLLDVWKGLGK